jgi:RNA polymerase sigma factor, sigma-70 family
MEVDRPKTPDAITRQSLTGLRDFIKGRDITDAAPQPAAPTTTATAPAAARPQARPRRETNAELLHIIRTAKSEQERSRAAEVLRRQVKSLCAAVTDRYTSALTAQEADDLTQEVMVRLITSAAGTARDGQVLEPTPAYIQRIAVNLLIDQKRFLDRRGLSRPGVSVDDSETAVSVPDPRVSVEADVVGKFHRRDLREALKRTLSPVEARVLWMRSDGASHSEIADALGIKEANARKHHERGLKRLKKAVDEGAFPAAA